MLAKHGTTGRKTSASERIALTDAKERAWIPMQDLLMLLYTSIFFAVAFLYVKACQKLR